MSQSRADDLCRRVAFAALFAFMALTPLAAQDAHLGGAYMKKYVLGWAENGFSYRAIPHEAQAFALADRFRRGEGAFSVAVEVARLFPPTVD